MDTAVSLTVTDSMAVVVANTNGEFTVEVPPGTYTVSQTNNLTCVGDVLDSDGGDPNVITIDVTAGDSLDIVFVLEIESDRKSDPSPVVDLVMLDATKCPETPMLDQCLVKPESQNDSDREWERESDPSRTQFSRRLFDAVWNPSHVEMRMSQRDQQVLRDIVVRIRFNDCCCSPCRFPLPIFACMPFLRTSVLASFPLANLVASLMVFSSLPRAWFCLYLLLLLPFRFRPSMDTIHMVHC